MHFAAPFSSKNESMSTRRLSTRDSMSARSASEGAILYASNRMHTSAVSFA